MAGQFQAMQKGGTILGREVVVIKKKMIQESLMNLPSTLYSGADIKYEQLPESIVVFITEFDPFGEGLYKYTFTNKCPERPEIELNDGATKIFLNTQGIHKDNASDDLISFLRFVHNSYEESVRGNITIRELYTVLQRLKGNKKVEGDYMDKESWMYVGREEGKQLLANAIRRLQGGETVEQFIASGVDSGTIELVKSLRV